MGAANKSKFISLRAKMMALFIPLIIVPFIVSGIFTYVKYSSNVEQNVLSSSQQLVEQMQISLDSYIKELERLTIAPLYDEDIINILKNHNGSYTKGTYLTVDEQHKMNMFLSSMIFDREDVVSILIFTNDGVLFDNAYTSTKQFWELNNTAWMEQADKEDGGLFIVPPHTVNYYSDGEKEVIALTRVLREPYTHEQIGYIKIDLKVNSLEHMFTALSDSNDSKLYIYDRDDHVLYPNTGEGDGQDIQHDSSLYASAVSESAYTGLKVMVQLSLHELKQEARELTSYTLLVSIISLLAAIFLATFISNRLVVPIRYLEKKMRLVKQGSFKERVAVTSNDEIGRLSTGFNQMIEELERLLKEVYMTRLRERDAEIAALQSQMSPHFLYNTLESINMLAIQNNQWMISDIAASLGRLLRYTVSSREQPFVLLRDELQFVESYLQIQALRFGDGLNTSIDVEPELKQAVVIKLILQPIVENVFEHAMGSQTVNLHIHVFRTDGQIVLAVEDDGVGMDEQSLLQLNERLKFESIDQELMLDLEPKRSGYALRNIHQRIQLLYGKSFGLSLKNNDGKGMTVSICLPLKWER